LFRIKVSILPGGSASELFEILIITINNIYFLIITSPDVITVAKATCIDNLAFT
jgi:hypothetical protein